MPQSQTKEQVAKKRLGAMKRAYDLRKGGQTFVAIERKLGHQDHNGTWAHHLVEDAEKLWGPIADSKLTIIGKRKKLLSIPSPVPAGELPSARLFKVDLPS